MAAPIGGLVASSKPRNPVDWIVLGHAFFFALGEFSRQYAIYGLIIEPGSLPLARALASPPYWVWFPGLMLVLSFLPLYFPDGRLVSPRWRPVAWLAVLATALLTATAVVRPGAGETRGVPNPLGVEALGATGSLFAVVDVVGACAGKDRTTGSCRRTTLEGVFARCPSCCSWPPSCSRSRGCSR